MEALLHQVRALATRWNGVFIGGVTVRRNMLELLVRHGVDPVTADSISSALRNSMADLNEALAEAEAASSAALADLGEAQHELSAARSRASSTAI